GLPPGELHFLVVSVADQLPSDMDLPAAIGQRSILYGIGGELVQTQREHQRASSRQCHAWSLENDPVIDARLERLQGLPDYLQQRRVIPIFEAQQVVCRAERMQAGEESLQLIRCVLRKV